MRQFLPFVLLLTAACGVPTSELVGSYRGTATLTIYGGEEDEPQDSPYETEIAIGTDHVVREICRDGTGEARFEGGTWSGVLLCMWPDSPCGSGGVVRYTTGVLGLEPDGRLRVDWTGDYAACGVGTNMTLLFLGNKQAY